MQFWKICAVALAIAVSGGRAANAAPDAGDPAARQIQTFYAALLDTMKHGPQLGMQGRYRALEPAVDATFDLPVMMQFIVGPGWATLSQSDKSTLVAAFRRMTIASYANNFAKFDGERFDVDPSVQQRGSDKIVQSKLVPSDGKPVPLIYRMRQSGAAWKVIDVLLEGYVSELAMRRSDFGSTLAAGGASALVAKINQLAESLLNGAKTAQ